ncbi:MAG: hypothetical protein M1832_000075 [Thelocarpon impressellum]|nr:MAG: hypothetical protein M1832_000075 [Thelocarpon impressellum]
MANLGIFLLLALLFSCVAQAQNIGPKTPRVRPGQVPTYQPPIAGTVVGPDFVTWIKQQVQQGRRELALQQGTYHVAPGAGAVVAHLYIKNLRNVTMWLDSVTLVMNQRNLTAFYFDACDKVTLYGPVVYWDIPGHAQATITAARNVSGTITVEYRPDAGYSTDGLVNAEGNMRARYGHPVTGRLVPSVTGSSILGQPVPISGRPGYFSMVMTPWSATYMPLVGHKIIARGNGIMCNKVYESNDTQIIDYTLLNCAGFGFHSLHNRRTVFDSLQIKRAPFPPPGGTELPARSSSADGVHSGEDIVGPTLDSCYFESLDDDCIAIHGTARTITAMGPTPNTFNAFLSAVLGDTLRFYHPSSFNLLGTAKITSITQIPGQNNFVVIVDALPLPVVNGTRFTNQDRTGSGFKIINTRTNVSHGHGALVKASDGIIHNNYFEASSYGGISVGPVMTYWSEGDWVKNVSIIGNTCKENAFIAAADAAIMLHGDGDRALGGNRDVIIRNNLLLNVTGPNLYVGAASSVSLGGNRFHNPYQGAWTMDEQWPGANHAIATFENVSFGILGQNCVTGTIGQAGISLLNRLGTVLNWQDSMMKQC